MNIEAKLCRLVIVYVRVAQKGVDFRMCQRMSIVGSILGCEVHSKCGGDEN